MKFVINFCSDPVDIEELKLHLTDGEFVVIDTTRPNFKFLASQVREIEETPVIALSVEDNEMSWYSYMVSSNVINTLVLANEIILQAVQIWKTNGSPEKFVTSI